MNLIAFRFGVSDSIRRDVGILKFISNADLLKYAKKKSVEHNVALTPLACAVFGELVKLYSKLGVYDEEKDSYYLLYSYREFLKALQEQGVDCQYTFLYNAFLKFEKCGLIDRVLRSKTDIENVRKPANTKEFDKVNKSDFVTYLDYRLFLEEE